MKRPPEAFRSSSLFETGIGYAVICRYKADGRCEAGIFLIDAFCIGVKDGDFASFSSAAEFEKDVLSRLFRDEEPVRMTPSTGRKLIEDAVAYARGLGFASCADYKKACRVLGGITTAECDEEFAFGSEGKPFYIQGPYDSAARARSILQTLERNCGAGRYHYLLPVGSDESGTPDEEAAQDWSDVALGSAGSDSHGLQEMARRYEAEQPGVIVRVNPPGRSKISDRLSLLAEPLLDAVPDYESKKAILHLAALAWNFTVAEGSGSEELVQGLLPLLAGGEGESMFDLLAARMTALFPEEDRIIGKVEIDPCAGNQFNIRVMSISPADNLPSAGALPRQRRARFSSV